MTIADALLPEFDHEMASTRKVLERVPGDRLDWKPHPKSYSIGALAAHVANLPRWGAETLTRAELDVGDGPPPAPPASVGELLAAFDGSVAAARAALVGRTDAELAAMWSLRSHGKTIFSMPKSSVLRAFVLSHLIHHRAQLTVYLRLLDIPVPSLYGPSADEPAPLLR